MSIAMHWFETDPPTRGEILTGLSKLNREQVAQAGGVGSPYRVVLDMDSSESPVYGEQEQGAYNGYFESYCCHPLFLFNSQGDCLRRSCERAMCTARGWEELGELFPRVSFIVTNLSLPS
jgi:hypothetical protein